MTREEVRNIVDEVIHNNFREFTERLVSSGAEEYECPESAINGACRAIIYIMNKKIDERFRNFNKEHDKKISAIRVSSFKGVVRGNFVPLHHLEEPWEAAVNSEEEALELDEVKRFKELKIEQRKGFKMVTGISPFCNCREDIAILILPK